MHRLLKILGSLKLTVVLLALGIVVVFFSTLDQAHLGIRLVQQHYYESILTYWSYPLHWPLGSVFGWLILPLPGGYLVGSLMIINLVCSHWIHFKRQWSQVGLSLTHAGIIIIIIGQLVTQLTQQEFFLWLEEGESKNYLESFHDYELAVLQLTSDSTGAAPQGDHDWSGVQTTATLADDKLAHNAGKNVPAALSPSAPFQLVVREYYPNAQLFHIQDPSESQQAPQAPHPTANRATRGIAVTENIQALPAPLTHQLNERNLPAAYVEILATEPSLRTVGIWLVSAMLEEQPQPFSLDGQEYALALRPRRTPLPASITLLDFIHERYPGTDIPKNFSSRVRIQSAQSPIDREALVYMNNPLRFAGYSFYQASFTPDDKSSMFQVVSNPGRWLPYIASATITAGLLFHFTLMLGAYLRRRQT